MSLTILAAASCLDASTANAKPVQVLISDKGTSPRTSIKSLPQIGNPAFRNFVSGVLSELQKSSGPYVIATSADPSRSPGGLSFIRIAAVSSGDDVSLISAATHGSASDVCVIRSPWAELAVIGKPARRITGTIFWNERQILQDQAVLANFTRVPLAPRRATSRSAFERLAQNYADQEISRVAGAPGREPGAVPADLLWLFRQSPQSTIVPFSELAQGAMHDIAERAARPYARLIIRFAEQCFNKPGSRFRYAGVTELGDAARGYISK